jgi:hypothetical protein
MKRVKRISSGNRSGPFLGSEFAYEDLVAPEVDKYEYRWIRDERCGNHSCAVVERTPRYEGFRLHAADRLVGPVRVPCLADRVLRPQGRAPQDARVRRLHRVRRVLATRAHGHGQPSDGKSPELVFEGWAFGTGIAPRSSPPRAWRRNARPWPTARPRRSRSAAGPHAYCWPPSAARRRRRPVRLPRSASTWDSSWRRRPASSPRVRRSPDRRRRRYHRRWPSGPRRGSSSPRAPASRRRMLPAGRCPRRPPDARRHPAARRGVEGRPHPVLRRRRAGVLGRDRGPAPGRRREPDGCHRGPR